MPPLQTEFDDLTTVVDNLHALFERWEAGTLSAPALDPVAREVLKLALHEWVANLVQHARFEGRPPLIRLRVLSEGRRTRCVVEDNSAGFDFVAAAAETRELQASSPVPTERGRGLLLLLGCTQNLSYRPSPPLGGDGALAGPWQRLEFWVEPNGEGLEALPLGPFFDDTDDSAEPAPSPDTTPPVLEAWLTPAPPSHPPARPDTPSPP